MKQKLLSLVVWAKSNKLTTFLLVVIFFFVFRPLSFLSTVSRNSSSNYEMGLGSQSGIMSDALYSPTRSKAIAPSYESAPRPEVTDRKIITTSSLSMQVKSVRDTMENIKDKVKALNGYVVNTYVTTPEFGESGYIQVRIPQEKMDETLKLFRSMAIKVVSENISGNDITDQYIDIQERIGRLEKTKGRFEEILSQAVKIEEILNVEREITNLQNQIDSYKGQLIYMDGASSTTLITINLDTDELGLPYTPANKWRPDAVFKQAVRSLTVNLIKVGNIAIWFVVYTPFILATWLAYKLIKRLLTRK